jgi:hypothetical protein
LHRGGRSSAAQHPCSRSSSSSSSGSSSRRRPRQQRRRRPAAATCQKRGMCSSSSKTCGSHSAGALGGRHAHVLDGKPDVPPWLERHRAKSAMKPSCCPNLVLTAFRLQPAASTSCAAPASRCGGARRWASSAAAAPASPPRCGWRPACWRRTRWVGVPGAQAGREAEQRSAWGQPQRRCVEGNATTLPARPPFTDPAAPFHRAGRGSDQGGAAAGAHLRRRHLRQAESGAGVPGGAPQWQPPRRLHAPHTTSACPPALRG